MKGKIRRLAALLCVMALLVPSTFADDGDIPTAGAQASVQGEQAAEAAELPGEIGEILLNDAEGTAEPSIAPQATPEATPEATQAPGEAEEAAQSVVPATLKLGVKQKYTLKAGSLAPGQRITYKSSKKSVATVSAKGVVKAVKKGTAKIRCYAGKTLLATCTVKVVAAPKKVSLGVKKLTLGVKESVTLTPSITKGSLATFTWSSSRSKYASVSKGGKITGKRAGKTTITVRTQNGKKATVTVTVAKAPGKVTMSRSEASLIVDETLQLKATLPKSTASYGKTWSSSDEGVARVSDKGEVSAVGKGEATITVETYNGKTATCAVTVSESYVISTPTPTPSPTPTPDPGPLDDSVSYRALLIGQEHFSQDTCTRNRGDVTLMGDMLESVRGLYGGKFAVTKQYDLNKSGVLKAIKSAYSGADENDISLFFIATHGDSSSTGANAGALQMTPTGFMRIDELAEALKAVPGKVIVILESCGSGAAIYANGEKSSPPVGADMAALAAFDRAVIEAFAAADPGTWVEILPNDVDSKGLRVNTGEMRLENKFYVLTASAYLEDSYGWEAPKYHNVFTMWLTEGIGTSGSMPADANRNGQVTLQELYAYIEEQGPHVPNSYANQQHVQVYPANSGFVLWRR